MLKNFIFVISLAYSSQGLSSAVLANSSLLQIDGHPLHMARWGSEDVNKPSVVLISGPIDSLFSDSAWWAALGPQLAKTHQVIALDRAGIATEQDKAPVGYEHFAYDLHLVLKDLALKNVTLIAFASSNLAVQFYLASHPEQEEISRVILIDPDVLTEFSIARYQADAKPFKDNLDAYLAFVNEGKYLPRIEQKNETDMGGLKGLAQGNNYVDWPLVDKMFTARLSIIYQQNLFREMAIYGQELNRAAQLVWPQTIPVMIIDTDFESKYIDKADDEAVKSGLLQWQRDAKQYYQYVAAKNALGKYVHTSTRAHLYQFAQPEKLASRIAEFELSASSH